MMRTAYCLACALAIAILPMSANAAGLIGAGTGEGSTNLTTGYVLPGLSVAKSFQPFAPAFTGGVRVAVGDISGDGVPDYMSGNGSTAQIAVSDGATLTGLYNFSAYQTTGFGTYVALGDVNHDGVLDMLTAPSSGTANIRAFSGVNGTMIRDFAAFAPTFTGGVRVAAGDVNKDGYADIVTGAGPGGSPNVKVFSGSDGTVLNNFFAFSPSFTGGIFVAAGDVNDDGIADLVAGTDSGVAAEVKVFDGSNLNLLADFQPYGPSFTGGVRVAAADLNGDGHAEIITGAGPGGGPDVKVFDGTNLVKIGDFFSGSAGDMNGVYVAAASVPEPASAGILACSAALLLRRRRKS